MTAYDPGRSIGGERCSRIVSNEMIDAHPDWSDQQIADRLNRRFDNPVITVDEVAHWRSERATA
ncbi:MULTISPECIES: hypothetical protein [unclassified Actinoplanes]|uniref:hypothetical protein n=1 Tax=unclassified Actinoplanes TaxID=2626549 RepID=UPI0012BA56CA|nr:MULTISPECIES: hypothetical protein [unclassified Actinoplanes]